MTTSTCDLTKLHIHHRISYRYSEPVFLEPITIRLCPRADATLRLRTYQLLIDPEPTGDNGIIDSAGNVAQLAWFEGQHDHLTITATSELEHLSFDPFGYLVTDVDALQCPVAYEQPLAAMLQPYLQTTEERSQAMVGFSQELMARSGRHTQDLLMNMVMVISERWQTIQRPSGPAWPSEKTLTTHQASCRDLAVLMINLCRHVGLAARFVSGYHHSAEMDLPDDKQLHAWVEVYLPGAGWRGYDPSYGVAVAGKHIALAAAPEPDGAAATSGSFRRTGASSTIDFEIDIRMAQV